MPQRRLPRRAQYKPGRSDRMAVEPGLGAAQSPDRRPDLLEIVDKLNEVGLGAVVALPRIIIVGHGPAVMRTVWEAIIGIPIPSMNGLDDYSEIEVVVAQSEETRVNLSIEGQSIDGFPRIGFNRDELPAIIEDAIRWIHVTSSDGQFLCLGIQGPGMPNLTLVDLPYMYDGWEAQINQTDAREIAYRQFVDKCMRQENNIILPVMSVMGEAGLATKLLHQVERYDKKHARTFGIVTVPENMGDNAERHSRFIKLAQNRTGSHLLEIGWHVLPDYLQEETIAVKLEHKSADADTEDPEPNAPVSKEDPWSVIQPQFRGAKHLRQRLETLVLERIRDQLSKVAVARIKQLITQHQTRLPQLGSPLAYMTRISLSFHELAREALRGSYMNEFFGELYTDASSSSYEDSRVIKFRALVRDLNNAFGHVMVTSGHKRGIFFVSGHHRDNDDDRGDEMVPSHLEPLIDLYDADSPVPVFLNDLERELEKIAPENQGTGFSGSVHDTMILRLFRDQIEPWEKIANRHIELTTHFARRFAEKLVSHLAGCDTKTADALTKAYVDPYFEKKLTELSAKLEELLYHYKHGYGTQILYINNPGLAHRKKNKGGFSGQPSNGSSNALVSFGIPSQQNTTSTFGTDQIVESMMTYYDTALRVFIDNVTTLAVENCLVRDIPNILNAVSSTPDKDLQKIAVESREELQKGLENLQSLLATCQGLLPQESGGKCEYVI